MTESVIGLEKLERKLKKLEKPQRTIARGLLSYYRSEGVSDEIERYPPLSSANRPPAPYYVRGTGTFTGLKNRGNSEKMSNEWTDPRTNVLGRNVRLTVKNNASYAPYVIGKKQALFHKRRGWPQSWRVIEITKSRGGREIGKQIDKDILKK